MLPAVAIGTGGTRAAGAFFGAGFALGWDGGFVSTGRRFFFGGGTDAAGASGIAPFTGWTIAAGPAGCAAGAAGNFFARCFTTNTFIGTETGECQQEYNGEELRFHDEVYC